MAVEANHEKHIDIFQVLLAPVRGLVEMLRAPSMHTSRVHRAEYLRSLSDEKLAQRGLRREDIVRHVYRSKITR